MKLVLTLFVSLCLVVIFSSQMNQKINQLKHLVSPPPQLEHYSMGAGYQLADILWIRAIQDFDYCEQQIFKNTCKGNSWLSKILDAATTLNPRYYVAYLSGGLALTILISDYAGASKIFDKGVREFPDRWNLLYRAGYHALYEEKNFAKASELFRSAGTHGAPVWTKSLADRLLTKKGQVEVGERLLSYLIQREEDPALIEQMRKKIEEVKNRPE